MATVLRGLTTISHLPTIAAYFQKRQSAARPQHGSQQLSPHLLSYKKTPWNTWFGWSSRVTVTASLNTGLRTNGFLFDINVFFFFKSRVASKWCSITFAVSGFIPAELCTSFSRLIFIRAAIDFNDLVNRHTLTPLPASPSCSLALFLSPVCITFYFHLLPCADFLPFFCYHLYK